MASKSDDEFLTSEKKLLNEKKLSDGSQIKMTKRCKKGRSEKKNLKKGVRLVF